MSITDNQPGVNKVIAMINSQLETAYQYQDKVDTGEWGAYRILEGSGEPRILKFVTDCSSTNIFDATPDHYRKLNRHLLKLGYPVPRYTHLGTLGSGGFYWIMEQLPGKPFSGSPNLRQIANLLELLSLQKGEAVSEKQDWSAWVKEVVFRTSCPRKEVVLSYSPETAAFLKKILRQVNDLRDIRLPNEDIVHGDFSYYQLMLEKSQITGLVDWQEAGCGDWLFDLTHLIYRLHDRPVLVSPVVELIPPGVKERIRLYLAFIIMEFLWWGIKYHPEEMAGSFSKAQSAYDFVFNRQCCPN